MGRGYLRRDFAAFIARTNAGVGSGAGPSKAARNLSRSRSERGLSVVSGGRSFSVSGVTFARLIWTSRSFTTSRMTVAFANSFGRVNRPLLSITRNSVEVIFCPRKSTRQLSPEGFLNNFGGFFDGDPRVRSLLLASVHGGRRRIKPIFPIPPRPERGLWD